MGGINASQNDLWNISQIDIKVGHFLPKVNVTKF